MKYMRCSLLTIGMIASAWCILASPTRLVAQTIGNNAVYTSTLLPLGRDLCDTVYRLLTGFTGFPLYPSTGAVIDARGVSGATNLTCTHGSPWSESGGSASVPSTIPLPATGGGSNFTPIIIPTPWILPANTHVIGQGDNIGSGTVIQAKANSFATNTSMIQFGTAVCLPPSGGPASCPGIAVENLVLDGQGQAINGITVYSGNNSYVDHVSLYQLLGTGLLVSAANSGPYSNINFDTGGPDQLSW